MIFQSFKTQNQFIEAEIDVMPTCPSSLFNILCHAVKLLLCVFTSALTLHQCPNQRCDPEHGCSIVSLNKISDSSAQKLWGKCFLMPTLTDRGGSLSFPSDHYVLLLSAD